MIVLKHGKASAWVGYVLYFSTTLATYIAWKKHQRKAYYCLNNVILCMKIYNFESELILKLKYTSTWQHKTEFLEILIRL